MDQDNTTESPTHVRTSLAAAMTLGLKKGLFYRSAELYCINLLLTYASGCRANCAYCGLARKRPGEFEKKSFIRVTWPIHPMTEITERIAARRDRIRRICISMITHPRAVSDTLQICSLLRASADIPVSILVSPTIISRDYLVSLRAAGALHAELEII